MATFRKVGDKVRAEVRRKKPAFYWSDNFNNMTEAKAAAAQVEADWYAGKRGETPNKTFGELMNRYSEEVSSKKKGGHWEQKRIKALQSDPLALCPLKKIDSPDVASWKSRRLETVKGSTVNREWNLYSSACNHAIHEWRWLTKNPFSTVKRPKNPRHRRRLITEFEVEALGISAGVETETVTGRTYQAFLFALETGMREGEIACLEPSDVETQHVFVRGEAIGAGKTDSAKREVPLSPVAIEIINRMLLVRFDKTVFGLTASQIESNFRRLRKASGTSGYTFHDSRHNAATEWAKRLKGQGARAVLLLCKMFGWKKVDEALTYFNESAEDVAKSVFTQSKGQ